MTTKKTICHISSVHTRNDIRVFRKECMALSQEFHVVYLLADGKGDEIKEGVQLIDAGKFEGRAPRMLHARKALLAKAKGLSADVFHLHDPELLLIARKLKKTGAKVVFDAHEDLPKQIRSKEYIPSFLRKTMAGFIRIIQQRLIKKHITGLVSATPHVDASFILPERIRRTVVHNYPDLSTFKDLPQDQINRNAVGYVGGIFRARGILEMMQAAQDSGQKLLLAGAFFPEGFIDECRKRPEWESVAYQGFISPDEIPEFIVQFQAGLCVLHPTPAYIDSLPIKIFEYMAAGIPVIASDFPIWRKIVEGNNAGICVDPLDTHKIAEAIRFLADHPDKAKQMGANGRKAAFRKYSWQKEAQKLMEWYHKLIND